MTWLIAVIPAIDELPGGEFAAVAADLSSDSVLVFTGEGSYPVGKGFLRAAGPCTITVKAALSRLEGLYRDGEGIGGFPAGPDLGDGQAAEVAPGWELYGWVDAGEDHKTFALIARSPSGRDIALVLLNRRLCCPGKADLALMMLWRAAESL
ncbi:MAG: hypothetical protein AVO35_01840 [Candidatus Aegiribacteria sp. MLS_C]|nr:MAG: hypothetical protein AVO35_01840 [Candidatus Aegiribacteria sp. MLS_C]